MRKAMLLLLLVLCVSSLMASAEDHDFRNVNWGMSEEEVKANETATWVMKIKEGVIAYKTKIAGFDAALYYEFVNDQLVNACYMFDIQHTNENDYIDDYEKLKTLLTKKYGSPISNDDMIWKDTLYQNKQDEYGFAVSIGHLVYLTKWETEDTLIDLHLSGDNYKIYLFISYTSKNLKYLLEKKQEEENMSGL